MKATKLQMQKQNKISPAEAIIAAFQNQARAIAALNSLIESIVQPDEITFEKVNDRAVFPTRASTESAGMDVYTLDEVTVWAGETKTIRTGIALASCPDFCQLLIKPKSRHGAAGHDIFAGVVDRDYRGEILVAFHNASTESIVLNAGDPIAQIVPIFQPSYRIGIGEIKPSERGAKGGITGDSLT